MEKLGCSLDWTIIGIHRTNYMNCWLVMRPDCLWKKHRSRVIFALWPIKLELWHWAVKRSERQPWRPPAANTEWGKVEGQSRSRAPTDCKSLDLTSSQQYLPGCVFVHLSVQHIQSSCEVKLTALSVFQSPKRLLKGLSYRAERQRTENMLQSL